MKYFLTFSFFLYSVFSFSQINILKKASDEAQNFIHVEIPLSSEQVSDA